MIASATGFGTALTQANAVASGSTTTVNLSLAPPGTVAGQVTRTSAGNAIGGATVNILEGGDLVGSGNTDPSGNYSIAMLAPGAYDAQASGSGYRSATQTAVSVTSGNTTTVDFELAAQSVIAYTYDEAGRLIGVVDPQGNAITYHYDAVGNLLSTSQSSSSQTAIIAFAPDSGPAGTTVMISGSGFSGIPGQNSVSFNGIAATIASATDTQLIATVPVGASTGTITVTAPSGTANSAASFTVTP